MKTENTKLRNTYYINNTKEKNMSNQSILYYVPQILNDMRASK